MSSMAGLFSQCEIHTNMGSINLANQNSATPRHLVITTTQHGSASDSEGDLQNSCIQYLAKDDVISVPKFVPANSPAIKILLESALDEGHIRESLHGAKPAFDVREGRDSGHNDPNQRGLGGCSNMTKASYPMTSQYRGVIKCAKDRFEAFVWDNTVEGSRGRTVYIGGYSTEHGAARAHDLVFLKIGGLSSFTNFSVSCYWKEIDEMHTMRKKEYIYAVRRKGGKGFSGSDSNYRGVYRITGGMQWQAWLGRDKGIPSIFLGTYYTAEDAARGYDIAVIRFKGREAITNFELTSYDVRGIMEKLPNNPALMSVPNSVTIETTSSRNEEGLLLLLQRGNNINEVACPPNENVNQSENNSSSNFLLHRHNHQQLSTPQLLSNSSSPSSSFQSNQNPNIIIQGSSCNLSGLAEIVSQHSSPSSFSFQGWQNPNDDLSGFIIGAESQLSNSSSSSPPPFQGHQDPNHTQSTPYNPRGLIGTGYQQSNISSSSSSFEGYQSSLCNLSGLNGAISQLSNSSSSPNSSFESYQNSNSIQSSSCNLGGLSGTSTQLSNSPSLLSLFQDYQKSNHNFGGLSRTRSQPSSSSASSSVFQGSQNLDHIQNSPPNLGGLTGTRSQLSNSSSLLSSFQGYQRSNHIQSRPCNLGRVIRTRSQLGNLLSSPSSLQGCYQNSSRRIRSSPYNVSGATRARSQLSSQSSSFQGYQNSNGIHRNPCYLIGGLTGPQLSNSSSLLPSSSPNYQNPNLIQSSSHGFGGLTGSGSQVGNYGTSIGDYGALVSNPLQGASLQQSMLFLGSTSQGSQAPQAFENQVHVNSDINQNLQNNQHQHQGPSVLSFQGNNNLGSQNLLSLSHLLPGFGTQLLGAGDIEDLSSAFNVEPQTMANETSGAANNNGVSSFMLNSNGINHVDVGPLPIQVPEAALPQLPPLVQSHEPNLPNNLNQNTNQNLNSCSSIGVQSHWSGANAGFGSQMIGSEDDFDITQYLNTAIVDDFDAWLATMEAEVL